jgi:hypothetical protein
MICDCDRLTENTTPFLVLWKATLRWFDQEEEGDRWQQKANPMEKKTLPGLQVRVSGAAVAAKM